MSRSFTIIPALIALLLSACVAPVEAPAEEGVSGESLGKKLPSAGVMLSPLAGDGEACKATADCMPTTKPCGEAACVNERCEVIAIPEGEPCQGGVGLCDGAGTCQKVVGVCKAWEGDVLRPCDADSECADSSGCTADTCEYGWCHHAPLPDGQACGSILSCSQGLCCVPQ